MRLDEITVGGRHRQELGDIDGLAASLTEVGLLHPVVVTPEGTLIAGQRRLAAAKSLGWTSVPVHVVDLDRIVRGEWAENTQRKDFTAGEQYAIKKALEPLEQAAAKARQKAGQKAGGRGKKKLGGNLPPSKEAKKARTRAAKAAGTSAATLAKITAVMESGFADLAKKMRVAEHGEVTRLYREMKRRKKTAEVKKRAALPETKFRVLYADPPWSYNDKCDDGAVQSGGAETHYESLSITQLCALTVDVAGKPTPVRDLCEKDAVLWLWVTAPLLFEAAAVFEGWGFKYKASFVWDKIKHNVGHYNSVRHELLLICVRGSCQPDVNELFDSVQTIERTKHSEKPERFREIIDTLYPHGNRLELFNRGGAPTGWKTWGYEAP